MHGYRRAVAGLLFFLLNTVPAAAEERSAECVSCHAAGLHRGPNHPSGVPYADTGRLRETRLRAPSLRGPDGIRVADLLVEGNVECVSCHFTHTETTEKPFRLRMNGTPTSFCLTCHVME